MDPVVLLVIPGRPRDIGSLTVRRVLPSMQRRLVGPFIFWDHMGPESFEPGHGIDVRPHPHIGLATVTYLFEGEMVHKDTLGSDQAIRPGAVNWMTAGRGIAHSERTGPEARKRGARVHGIQSWVALPVDREEDEPGFEHHPAQTIPETSREGVRLRVLAGAAFGLTAPARVASPTLYVEANLPAGARLVLPEEHEERAAYVVEGEIECGGQGIAQGEMVVVHPRVEAVVSARLPARVMLLGGASLGRTAEGSGRNETVAGTRHIWWNFVSSSQERIEQAKRDWTAGRFGKVPGDDVAVIPLPDR
jgi:redox-sensitive bicupin YhaK (pirin superfamily)